MWELSYFKTAVWVWLFMVLSLLSYFSSTFIWFLIFSSIILASLSYKSSYSSSLVLKSNSYLSRSYKACSTFSSYSLTQPPITSLTLSSLATHISYTESDSECALSALLFSLCSIFFNLFSVMSSSLLHICCSSSSCCLASSNL